MQSKISVFAILVRRLTIGVLLVLFWGRPCLGSDPDYEEAIKQTEEEWAAVRQTMQETKSKFDDFLKKYQEYEDVVFSQDMERGIELARRLFKLDKNQTEEAKKRLSDLREMFNTLDRNGIKTKLKAVSEKLEFADKVAGEVENVWQFAKKFDPAHAKDNPTYGLRLIGDLLKEGAGKMEKVPLVGQILGKWISAYGEVAGDFANALDRLGKKIEEFRGGSLCGQLGYKTDQQKAFEAASKKGEDCLTYFPYGGFSRLQGEAYEGNSSYFLYDPRTKQGYFSPLGTTDKVYHWHELLLKRVALYPDWLANRSNSLKPETEQHARELYALFSGLKNKTDPGWRIIDALGLEQDVYFYGKLDEETFVANYIIDKEHHDAIDGIVKKYEKYVLVSGTVEEQDGDEYRPSANTTVTLTINGKSKSAKTDERGRYEIILEGKVNDAVHEEVSKEGFETIKRDGHIPSRAVTGNNYLLRKETMKVVIQGTVSMAGQNGKPATPVSGAKVTASAPAAEELGSATSGGGGSYQLTAQVPKGVQLTLTAATDSTSGSTSITVTSAAMSGVDIVMHQAAKEEEEKKQWQIQVTVLDDNGNPLPGAVVTPSLDLAPVTTGGDGTATLGPLDVPSNWEQQPFTVTLTPSIVAQGGIKVSGSSQSITYKGETPSAVTLNIPVVLPQEITINGKVVDVNGIGIGGASVSGGGLSTTTSPDGSFSIGPFGLIKDSSISLIATLQDGNNTYSGGPVTCTYTGTGNSINGITIALAVEMEAEVTISGYVRDLNGEGIPGATVTGGGVSTATDNSGHYTLPAFTHRLGTPVSIAASVPDGTGGVASNQVEVIPRTETVTAPAIVLQVVMTNVYDVVISGSVVDENGVGIAGAVVTAGSASTTTDGAGTFSLPPIEAAHGEAIAVSATYSDSGVTVSGGPVTVTVDSTHLAVGGVVITLQKKKNAMVTISGKVASTEGDGIGGAAVSGGGQSTTTDGSGNFSLPPFEHELGTPLTIFASATKEDGTPASGQASVTPTTDFATVSIVIDMSTDTTSEPLDSLLDDLEDEVAGDSTGVAGLLAQFNAAVDQLDGIATDFYLTADYFDQRLRELREAACESNDVSYSLNSARQYLNQYSAVLDGVFGLYADLTAAQAAYPEAAADLANVEALFNHVVSQETALQGRFGQMQGSYATYECDEDNAETETGETAQDDADPDDVEGGADDGGGVEVCGDGIDNDGDNEIDECDAGCCDKNVQITVTDCGTAADDIFLVAVDGGDVGVTPKGAANTFNVQLSPGTHTVRVTCLDDGGIPPGTDIGTACVSIVVYGTDAGIGGGEMAIPYGGSSSVSFTVPEGPATTTVIQNFNGTTLMGLEKK